MEKPHETSHKTDKPAKIVSEPRNFLAAFLLVVSFGPMGINRLYTGETTMGWIRFGLFTAGMLLSPVVVGLPLLLAAQVWGWVDVFLVYHGSRTDAEGSPLTQTLRDRKLAKILYIIFIVTMILAIIAFVVMFILAVVLGVNQRGEFMNDNYPNFYHDSSY